ncbi:hypothetical protein HCG51_35065 (plasmid) [Tolypothrix sp. PCC 7910]|uniref:AAA-like domain-containing protein n=1 Tax=Tolypothrix sp. PCC 7910 TaxID=2099387 RepID=UPI00142796B3|nr:AAA-like domain-containing protein [Tolypothrix sp. PCC 7910]QIR41898.1 hypothetical protein HCG51_35065 [Tolypothrix sp. PCC 7910]
MIGSSSNFYQIGASLPVDAPSYVQRQADEEFYLKLQAGKFCYVLNSRQMGKSSLRVQTMQRLQKQGTVCAAIDLTGIGKVSQEQWYGGIVYNLSESCQLEDKFDFDWQIWWQKHQNILSPVQCLSLFIEKVLLAKIQQPIVIFVDEIDKVLSQYFSLDDFFALIRFFQNQRVDNPIFERLTFALLGVATPGDLITNKTQTPFNIGEAIELHGFQIDEVEPLIKGLQGKFNYPQRVMAEILDWTGGQPFLTQKLCKFMVEESGKENPRSVEEVVKSRIIENWESQDDPEHLRTIRDRILANEQRAGYLLELYQQIQQQGEVAANNSVESSELRLSGLVVKIEGKLRVYNRVYQQVFNQSWAENQLNNLRPYSEAFRAWVASGGKDESRLLRGNTLKGAEEWGKDKNLSYQDKQFLAASKEKEIQEEIAASEQAAQLERERKDKEAAEQRNKALAEANKKARQRIRSGTVILIFTLLGAGIVGLIFKQQVADSEEYLQTVETFAKLAGQLEDEGSDSEAKELFSQAGQSVNIKDHKLKQAVLYTGISYAYQKLKSKDFKKSQDYLEKSQEQWKYLQNYSSNEALQIRILNLKSQGNLFKEQGKTQQAIEEYKKAFEIFNKLKREGKRGKTEAKISPPFISEIKIKILSKQNVEALHREFIALLSKNGDKNLKIEVKKSLTEHYLDELNNLLVNKKWQEADKRTERIMLYIANREEQGYFDPESLKKFSCDRFRHIDLLWLQNSNNRFGFSVQKEIWVKEGLKLGITEWTDDDEKAYSRFASRVGWYDDGQKQYYSYSQVISKVEREGDNSSIGILPESYTRYQFQLTNHYFSRAATCKL